MNGNGTFYDSASGMEITGLWNNSVLVFQYSPTGMVGYNPLEPDPPNAFIPVAKPILELQALLQTPPSIPAKVENLMSPQQISNFQISLNHWLSLPKLDITLLQQQDLLFIDSSHPVQQILSKDYIYEGQTQSIGYRRLRSL